METVKLSDYSSYDKNKGRIQKIASQIQESNT